MVVAEKGYKGPGKQNLYIWFDREGKLMMMAFLIFLVIIIYFMLYTTTFCIIFRGKVPSSPRCQSMSNVSLVPVPHPQLSANPALGMLFFTPPLNTEEKD